MFSIPIPVPLDKFISGCWNCFSGPANYVCELEKNFHALETAMEELTDLKNDMKRKVRLAEEQLMTPLDQVQRWISRVEAAEVEINEVIRGGREQIDKLCLGGCCSKNCKSSYTLGKKVVQKLEYVENLKSKGVFDVVADTLPSAPVDLRPSEPAVGMESTFDRVWSCLRQEKVGIVGLFGLGGVGKTTLLNQINNQFHNTPCEFDFVFWVLVSKDLNLQKIQHAIGEKIGFPGDSWKQKSQNEKATDIHKILSKKKFVLLLDDIWERVDILDVGVPLPNDTNNCKLVFTTRSKEVCGFMDAHRKFEVECLPWEKAWQLFQEKVGDDPFRSHPDILTLAESVAQECDGLPLALITVGRAMACKNTKEEWEDAIDTLRNSASEFSGMEDKVFAVLKFSFDNLKDDKYRSCFLYCALFPEDFVIVKRDLIEYWIGEGFLSKYNDVNRARNEGHQVVGTLLNACLLEDENGQVKMHDVIRDMALWIACGSGKKEKENYFLVHAGTGLTKVPNIGKWKGAKRISLMANKIRKLAITPLCLNLTTLLLNNNDLAEISDGVFHHMPNLLVLDLSNNSSLKKVPVGISKLVSLQYLNLSRTAICELPIQLRSLVNLKYLNLEDISEFHFMPVNLISCFSRLQVCIMTGCGPRELKRDSWDLFIGNESLMDELESLKDLQDLRLVIRRRWPLKRYSSSKKLQCCTRHLSLEDLPLLAYISVSSLKDLNSLDNLAISNTALRVFDIDWEWAESDEIKSTEDLQLSIIRSKSFFHNLHRVSVEDCDYLRDMRWLIFAPNIKYLTLKRCNEMEEVIGKEILAEFPKAAANLNPFSRLETLYLYDLSRLKIIYPNALIFPYLNEVRVIDCEQLRRLPLNSTSAKGRKIKIIGDTNWWVKLHWEDEAARNTFLTSFINRRSVFDF